MRQGKLPGYLAQKADLFPKGDLFRDPTGSWEPLRRESASPVALALPLPGRWVGGDYRLLPSSPAINGGEPHSTADPDDSRVDIGAFFTEQSLRAFVRGDVDGNGEVRWNDLLLLARHLVSGVAVPCADAADLDDGGNVNAVDLLSFVVYLFSGLSPPTAPFPDCGLDPTFGEGLACETTAKTCLDVPE